MPTPPELLASLEGSDDPDALVLLQMAHVGADWRQPHSPEFAFEADALAERHAAVYDGWGAEIVE